jgi:hypothetical protein
MSELRMERLTVAPTTARAAGVTQQGLELVRHWLLAKRQAEAQRARFYAANEEERKAEEALANWLKPECIKPEPGEKIAVWVGDSLFQVEVGGTQCGTGSEPGQMINDKVTIRYRGTKFEELTR